MADYSTLTSNLGLGAGLGLQANPKNYVPEAMRAEQFQQKLGIDKENKRLADKAKAADDAEKDYKDFLLNFKQPTTGLGAFSKARQEDVANATMLYQKLKKDPKNLGKNVNSDPELMSVVNKALENERLRRFIEDRYVKQLDEAKRVGSSDDEEVIINEEFSDAINDPSGEKIKQYNIKYFNNDSYSVPTNVDLVNKRQTNAMKLAPQYGAKVRADKRVFNTETDDLGNVITTVDTEGLEKSKKEMWEAFKALESFNNTVDRMVRKQSMTKDQAEGLIYNAFDNAVQAEVSGYRKTKPKTYTSAFGNGLTDRQDVNVIFLTTGEDPSPIADKIYEDYIVAQGKEKGIKADTFNKLEEKVVNLYKEKGYPLQTRENLLDVVTKGGNYQMVSVNRTDPSKNREMPFKGDFGTENGMLQGIVKAKVKDKDGKPIDKYYFSVDVTYKTKGGVYIQRKLFPVEMQSSTVFGEYGLEKAQKDMDNWFNAAVNDEAYSTNVKIGKKKEQGGYAEKQVLKKFHDKTNKKTKLVFDDGTEEILNGIF